MSDNNSVERDVFLTQRSIMAGTWDIWPESNQREHCSILVREAYRTISSETNETEILWVD